MIPENLTKSFLFIFLILSACTESSELDMSSVAIPTIVTGQIKNYSRYPNTKIVKLNKREVGGVRDSKMEARIEPDGSFKLDIEALKGEEYFLKPFNNLLVFLNPGDSIHVNVDLDSSNKYEFSGSSKDYNHLLNDFYNKGYYGGNRDGMDIISTMGPEEYLTYKEEIKNNFLHHLDRFVEERNVSKQMSQALEGQILNEHYGALLEYGFSYCSVLNEPKPEELQMQEEYQYFKEVVDGVRNNAQKMQQHSSFDKLLQNYGRYYIQNVLKWDPIKIENIPNRYSIYLNTILEQETNKVLKEHLLHEFGMGLLNNNPLSDFEEYQLVLFNHIESPDLVADLAMNYENKLNFGDDLSPIPIYDLKNMKNTAYGEALNKLADEHKGKVLYLDFWGTYCPPCIADMVESKEIIRTEYKNKNIEFFYLNVNDEERGKQFVMDNDIPGNHVYLNKEQAHGLMPAFGNSAMPFQILINKNGKVVRKGNHLRLRLDMTQRIIGKLLVE